MGQRMQRATFEASTSLTKSMVRCAMSFGSPGRPRDQEDLVSMPSPLTSLRYSLALVRSIFLFMMSSDFWDTLSIATASSVATRFSRKPHYVPMNPVCPRLSTPFNIRGSNCFQNWLGKVLPGGDGLIVFQQYGLYSVFAFQNIQFHQ